MSEANPRAARRALAAALLIGALAIGSAASAVAQPVAGTPLVDLLAGLRERGLTVIFSSDLVPMSLRVGDPPTATDPLGQLEQVLAPHGLALQAGPRGSWLVIRAPEAETAAPTAPPPTAFSPAVPPLELVVVSASRYAFGRATATSESRIDRAQLENAPVLGEDALRTTHALPGLTSSGLTARVNVRGGESNEALVLLDGVRLFNPYHLKDFQGLFGSISPRIIDVIDVRTGGYSAEFGDRMSAVIEMRSIEPEDARHYEIGVSTLTSSVLSSGRFAEGRGAWVTSLRRGNLDLLIDMANSEAGEPKYSDFFNKLSFDLSDRLSLTSGALVLNDRIYLSDAGVSEAHSDYEDEYLWLTLEHEASSRLSGRYLLSRARLHSERTGSIDDADIVIGMLADERQHEISTLEADWSWELSERGLLRFGATLSNVDAGYRFAANRELPYPITPPADTAISDPTPAARELSDRRRGVYASYRLRATARLTTELGMRWDEQSRSDERQVSPRISALFDLGTRSTLRASWGTFYQAQGIDELQIGDGLTELFPAQESGHSVVSFEHLFSETLSLRIEVYRKEFEQLRPRFENLFTRVSLLPELLPDRVVIAPLSSDARGVEISLAGERGDWQWWANWTRADVEDQLASGWVRRSWAEPWSAKGGMIHSGARWTVSAGVTVRSGWPLTQLDLDGGELVAGALNAEAFETFQSLDLRASRRFMLEGGSVELFFELQNALNSDNPCCFDYALETDPAGVPEALLPDIRNWLPTVPSLGFLWTF